MPKAVWNGVVLAESDSCVEVEGNSYFPPGSVRTEHLKKSTTTTVCPWKGTASYYTIEVSGKRLEDGAWYYPDPKSAAMHIKNHVAFWKGVRVED
jgi:uncharacterized protein (DUF427 family)